MADTLTRKQREALRIFNREGELNEGMLGDAWPLIRNPRLVTNGLVVKGIVTLGCYWNEDIGYELHLTEAGRAAADALREERP